ncbi:50S ribosomal protein L1 [Candidatus Woesearchaeota archaeon]|nr:50S ribosomal protein L1 [Candidatus Woesearchaeota archaeon]
MDIKQVQDALKKAREQGKKRNFSQTVDLIITLQNLDLKKPEQQVDTYITLHYPRGKPVKVCALVGPELKDEAEKICDKTLHVDEFNSIDQKKAKKLTEDYDFFIAQANMMGKVATTFGKILGPRGKMPNPKAGCVVPPKAGLKPLYDKLQKTLRLTAKTALMIQCFVGNEAMKDEEIVDNIMTAYKSLINVLPAHENNIKTIYLKLTMGKPVKVL